MTTASAASKPLALAIGLTLLTVGFAGCIGQSTEGEFSSFEDARQQTHTTVEPEEASTLRLGLLEPTTTDNASQGQRNVTFLVWDEIENEPVEDATFTLDAFMPMMGHGTNPEEDPEHLAHGVYRGATNLMMGGDWLIYLNATLADGGEVSFQIPLSAEGGGSDGHGGHHDGPTTEHDSYEEAKDAEGETFSPRENTTIRAKLLDPAQREGLEQGETNVTVLFFDQEADQPVEDGNATLDAKMPAMGHGTSPEEDPVHAMHGVWKGMTTFAMNGTWNLHLELETGNETLTWRIEVTVGDAGGNGSEDRADEPAFEPYEVTFQDEVTSADYAQSYGFDVEAANATLTMNGTLANATALTDELTVDLLDPEGDELGSFTLSSDTTEASLTVEEAPAKAEHEVNVTGQALGADYTVSVYVTPP